ncbi:MAG TPA: MIP/aquaporin family protein [Candidatus Kapabacteria bacterium]|jgi:aquaporin Z
MARTELKSAEQKTTQQEAASTLADFHNSSLEMRRLFAEALGTFLLVIASAGGVAMMYWSHGKISLGMAMASRGLMVMAIIYFMGAVSGAHINPSITFAFALRRNFPWRKVPGYLVAQFVGAMLAMWFLYALLGDIAAQGASKLGEGVTPMQGFVVEMFLNATQVCVILGTASGARNIGTNGAIAIGGYVALAGFLFQPMTGASMNPFRSLAPDIFRGNYSMTWIYFAGPFAGAVIGVICEWILKGPPTKEGTEAAMGSLGRE